MDDDINKEDKIANELYGFVREFAILKLESETKREDSLIQQSINMQIAFSFTTAALFMVAAISVEYRGAMSLEYLLLAFSTITALLLTSLVFASMAQNRHLIMVLPNIDTFEEHIADKYKEYIKPSQRDKAFSELICKVQKDKERINDIRVNKIIWSMRFFYGALGLSVFWFFVALYIMF